MVSMVKTIDNKLNEIKNKLHGTRVFEPTTWFLDLPKKNITYRWNNLNLPFPSTV